MAKKRKKKAFWHNIRFKYRLTITNENTLVDIVTLRVSKLNGISVLLSALTVLFLAASLIVAFTPLRNYLPGYMNSEIRAQVVDNALRADSLQRLLERQDLYIMNIQDIFRGKVRADTVRSIDSLTNMRKDSLIERTRRETDFRKQYEEAERYNLTSVTVQAASDGLVFYHPARGILTAAFDAGEKHFGIDIAARPGESILAALDGTVVLGTYTAEAGYVIEVQHNQDFISVYKHCGGLLKEAGEAVKGGEAIAIAGSGGLGEAAQRLHFELWHKGKAVNPELYIVF